MSVVDSRVEVGLTTLGVLAYAVAFCTPAWITHFGIHSGLWAVCHVDTGCLAIAISGTEGGTLISNTVFTVYKYVKKSWKNIAESIKDFSTVSLLEICIVPIMQHSLTGCHL